MPRRPTTARARRDDAAGGPGEKGKERAYEPVFWNDSFGRRARDGVFPEGAVIVKELALLRPGDYPDGSRQEPSGRGYVAAGYGGVDRMVKDSSRFAETIGWGFLNFGRHAPPYADVAVAAPNDTCAYCHTANATKDMVFTTFYPILR